MKTAMQTLLEDIEFLMPQTYKSLNKKFKLKTFYLEKEKQQIIEAAETGLNSLHFKTKDSLYGKKYYNDTFNKKDTWYNEYETTERMNIIGQNGNDGEHYENK